MSGNRGFGLRDNGNGTWTFYTKGADRETKADSGVPYRGRVRAMLIASAAAAISTFVGEVTGSYDALAVALLALWSFGAGMFIALGLPAYFVRKEAKTYGTCQLAEGGVIDGARLTVIEDVVTSGGQVIASCGDLRDRGAVVEHALCVIDRESGGPEGLTDIGVELRPLFTMTELKRWGEG